MSGTARRVLTWPVQRALRSVGYKLAPVAPTWPRDFDEADVRLWQEVKPYTMTSPAAIRVLADSVQHITSSAVPGAIVECGVWRGGSMMAIAHTLRDLGRTDVDLCLFDTFVGMTEPTEKDVHRTGERADVLLARESHEDRAQSLIWASADLDSVRRAVGSTGYPSAHVHFVTGKVEDTIPEQAPDEIALLRLDTDWYESTRHELLHLYPRLSPGGVLIIDDYGVWRGSAEATDEYFTEHGHAPFLIRIDDGGARVAVKPPP
ncbi:class I SAM-dependent methyltransferase [Streptomyces sp. ISL-98]|uniref:TylF/MycF/NovP-related O-methyltransferase n=1 Tax=Streptomyces sp. ISL-98 TaxID=2819192 RepID=UPI001BE6CF77|nr:TylF/MycF/NovP-related O-methyltransferase [Streptomyces sp. ISL-98]MBT2510741.1 class I SAM-dependent methyltransferase [Streptomyces sp. ISL-98]